MWCRCCKLINQISNCVVYLWQTSPAADALLISKHPITAHFTYTYGARRLSILLAIFFSHCIFYQRGSLIRRVRCDERRPSREIYAGLLSKRAVCGEYGELRCISKWAGLSRQATQAASPYADELGAVTRLNKAGVLSKSICVARQLTAEGIPVSRRKCLEVQTTINLFASKKN